VNFTARRVLSPAFSALALALTVVGTFLPLFRTEEPAGTDSSSGTAYLVQGAWQASMSVPGQDEISAPTPPIGLSLLLAAAILLAAMVLSIRQAAIGRPGEAPGRTTLAGAAFLAGAVCTIALLGMGRALTSGRLRAETTPLAGTWLLIAAVVAAVAAAALSFGRSAAKAGPADTETPPSGVVITVLPPEHD
jgi:hypothetical protein